VRLRDAHGTYVYRVGSIPDAAACTTIWCYGDKGVPWTSTAGGEPIWAHLQPISQPTRRRSWRMALVEPFMFFVDPEGELDKETRRRRATLAMRAYYARLEHSTVTEDRDADHDPP
jgi:hypothetical protein